MKKFLCLFIILLFLLFIPFGLPFFRGSGSHALSKDEPLRAVWIASVYNIDFPSANDLTVEALKTELDTIVDNTAAIGANALFFQVRPTTDALYRSDIFPLSRWLVPKEGASLAGDFDPLAYLIKQAAEKDIGVHAWLNPYKVTRGSAANPAFDLSYMAADNPLRQYPDILVYHSNGEVYMDPGEPQSRKLILSAVEELLTKYDLAGIHYDDYFYPDGDFEDADSFRKYGQDFASVEDWRRDNVNTLIKETYELVKSIDDDLLFGVSPAGVWANRSSTPLGSATWGGSETYYSHYADSRKWVLEGWLDYITPQIYWNIGYEPADYAVLIQWWAELTRETDVALYPGIALYKLGDASQSAAWLECEEIIRQLELNRSLGIEGECFYGYGKIRGNFNNINTYLHDYYAN